MERNPVSTRGACRKVEGGGGYIYNMQWLYINILGVKELSA